MLLIALPILSKIAVTNGVYRTMTLSINASPAINREITTGNELIAADLEKSQQELVGELAIDLVESAVVNSLPSPPSPTVGQNVNIRA